MVVAVCSRLFLSRQPRRWRVITNCDVDEESLGAALELCSTFLADAESGVGESNLLEVYDNEPVERPHDEVV